MPQHLSKKSLANKGRIRPVNLDAVLDSEISEALNKAIAAASPAKKLALLSLIETPGALAATEKFITAVAGERR